MFVYFEVRFDPKYNGRTLIWSQTLTNLQLSVPYDVTLTNIVPQVLDSSQFLWRNSDHELNVGFYVFLHRLLFPVNPDFYSDCTFSIVVEVQFEGFSTTRRHLIELDTPIRSGETHLSLQSNLIRSSHPEIEVTIPISSYFHNCVTLL